MTSEISQRTISIRSLELSPTEEIGLSECEAIYGNGDGNLSISEYESFQKMGPELCRLEEQMLTAVRRKFFSKKDDPTLAYEASDLGKKAVITVRLQKGGQQLAEEIFVPGESLPRNPIEFSLITSGLLDRVQETDRSSWFLLIRSNYEARRYLQKVIRDSHPQFVSRFFESLLTSRDKDGFGTESHAIWISNTLWMTLLGTQSETELKRATKIITGISNRSYQAFLMAMLHFRSIASYDKILSGLPSPEREEIEKMIVTFRPHLLSISEYLQIKTDRIKKPPAPPPLEPALPYEEEQRLIHEDQEVLKRQFEGMGFEEISIYCHNALSQYEEGLEGPLFREGEEESLAQEDLLPLYQEALKKRGNLTQENFQKYETRSDPNPMRLISMTRPLREDGEWFAYFLPPPQEMVPAIRRIENEIKKLVEEGLTVDNIDGLGIPLNQVLVSATHHQLGSVIDGPGGSLITYATSLRYYPEKDRLIKEVRRDLGSLVFTIEQKGQIISGTAVLPIDERLKLTHCYALPEGTKWKVTLSLPDGSVESFQTETINTATIAHRYLESSQN
ncbi:MAG: hypothetical protein HY073_01950 [Deltaproteobacteria bacterium]|nr:hypothetical protein [Deltaproteobacteria bacterium]